MDALPYEAQTAVVSLIAALLIGGPVSIFGFSNVTSVARLVIMFAVRRRMVTAFGISALAGGGAFLTNLFGFGAQDAESAGLLASILG